MVDRFLFLHDESCNPGHVGPPSGHVTVIVYQYIQRSQFACPVFSLLPVTYFLSSVPLSPLSVLLRETYIDSYLTSAENYRTLRAEIETPDKAALVYRDFVHKAVRRSVLEWKAFRPRLIKAMAAEADIPEADREDVVNYIGNEFRSLHEGNVIRYRLRPEDLGGMSRIGLEASIQ